MRHPLWSWVHLDESNERDVVVGVVPLDGTLWPEFVMRRLASICAPSAEQPAVVGSQVDAPDPDAASATVTVTVHGLASFRVAQDRVCPGFVIPQVEQ